MASTLTDVIIDRSSLIIWMHNHPFYWEKLFGAFVPSNIVLTLRKKWAIQENANTIHNIFFNFQEVV